MAEIQTQRHVQIQTVAAMLAYRSDWFPRGDVIGSRFLLLGLAGQNQHGGAPVSDYRSTLVVSEALCAHVRAKVHLITQHAWQYMGY
jgi:hypothetical protein